MLGKEINDLLKQKNGDKPTITQLLDMSDEDVEEYIESLNFTDIADLYMNLVTMDYPLLRILPDTVIADMEEMVNNNFTTVDVREIFSFLNAIAGDSINDEEMFFIYGTIAMLKCMYDEKKKEYKPKHAKTATN